MARGANLADKQIALRWQRAQYGRVQRTPLGAALSASCSRKLLKARSQFAHNEASSNGPAQRSPTPGLLGCFFLDRGNVIPSLVLAKIRYSKESS